MKAKITKRAVDAAKPAGRDWFLWDTSVTGFGLKVTPAGGKVYVLQHRVNGRVRRFTIGGHGKKVGKDGKPWTPDLARQEAERLLGDIASGRDPAIGKAAARKAPTVSDACDRYLSEHVEVHNRPRTGKEFRRLVERQIKPRIGKMRVKDISRGDVVKLHHDGRSTPRQANQTLAVLSKLFNLCELWGWRDDNSNPCRLIKRFPKTKRERFLSENELALIGGVLDDAETQNSVMPEVIAAIRLLALSGCRLSEVLELQWQYVDFDTGALYLPDAKAGGRFHPIGARALAVLVDIPRVDKSPWVFNGKKSGAHLSVSTIESAWKRFREAAKLPDCRLHDLRHTVGTYAGQTGANAFLIRDKLGHKTLAMTGRYVNRDTDPIRELSDTVENRIDAAMRRKETGEVIPLDRKA